MIFLVLAKYLSTPAKARRSGDTDATCACYGEANERFSLILTPGTAVGSVRASSVLVTLLVELVIPLFSVPRLGLSAHVLGILQGVFLIVVGLLGQNSL